MGFASQHLDGATTSVLPPPQNPHPRGSRRGWRGRRETLDTAVSKVQVAGGGGKEPGINRALLLHPNSHLLIFQQAAGLQVCSLLEVCVESACACTFPHAGLG